MHILGGDILKQPKTIFLLLCLLCALLCGCGRQSSSDYFALPQSATDDERLRSLLSAELDAGFEYAAPVSGERRQPLQLIDLDGDGKEELLAFLRNRSTETCRIEIFDPEASGFSRVLLLEGRGSSLKAVDCADLTGDGTMELVCAWDCGAELELLYVYDLRDWGGEVLLADSCTEFLCHDLSGDSVAELVSVSFSGSDPGVSTFFFPVLDESAKLSAPLSAGIAECCRIRGCTLEGNTPGVLVESYLESGELVSDLFSMLDGKLFNITLDQTSGVSRTKRSYAVMAADIDGDHFLEIPIPAGLYAQQRGDHYRFLSWVGFNRYGFSVIKQETYHCFVDGWYFVLPQGWSDTLTVRRDDTVAGERCLILSDVDRYTGKITDKLMIYTLTGENRHERAAADGRFVLCEDETTVYAASVLSGIARSDVAPRFHLIYSEWTKDSL